MAAADLSMFLLVAKILGVVTFVALGAGLLIARFIDYGMNGREYDPPEQHVPHTPEFKRLQRVMDADVRRLR